MDYPIQAKRPNLLVIYWILQIQQITEEGEKPHEYLDLAWELKCWLVRWLAGFYGISTIVGYSMPNPF